MLNKLFSGWTGDANEQDEPPIWEDNWDDDVIEDDFTDQLRLEFQRQGNALNIPEIVPNINN